MAFAESAGKGICAGELKHKSELKTHFPLQDAYLLAIKRENAPVTIYLRNGFQLRGYVRGFDSFTIILEYDNKPHLVYKHAVSTVSPQTPVQFSSADLAPKQNSESHTPTGADGAQPVGN